MFLDVKTGKKGELVIPTVVHKKFGIEPVVKDPNVMDRIRKLAKTTRIKGKIIYGDALFEDGFFE